ncbi:MAG: YraN family protein [Puniceicoccales bacterium]|nr:YraN family protein [Puniceicoccales bacterium]
MNLGKVGEDLAVDFLRGKNFKILARNWTYGKGELDVVAFDGASAVLVFIEVKLRSGRALVPGYFAVDAKKKSVLRRTCMGYLRAFTSDSVSYRFDVIEVRMGGDGKHEISHYENVKLF